MPSYVLKPHKHVKIWFSKDSDVFLNAENQLRLVKFRTKNPRDEVALVFSKQLLSESAQQDLFIFCNQHKIKPLSLEEDIEPQLTLTEEQQLIAIAKM
ncbi:MAG: glycosyltransferase family 88 protein, partial [Methylococcales bacterium]|nr:glycosyltransferase family 88 protein [Methylococcales bacterium]